MIVDVHTHPFESTKVLPKAWLEGWYKTKVATFGEATAKRLMANFDASVDALLRDMDAAGVDMAVVAHLDYSIYCQQEPEVSVWRANEYLAEMQAKYPDRIIAFVGVDPRRKDAIALLEKAVGEWKVRGIKVMLNCPVTDEVVQPFMAKMNDLGVPAIFHMGTSPAPHAAKYGNPADLDLLTHRYPGMKVIAAHVAKGYSDLLLAIIKYRAGTIATDISSFQYDYYQSRWHFLLAMREMMDKIPNSVMMGSDWPFIIQAPLPTYKEWFDAIRGLKIPEPLLQLDWGMKQFSDEEKEKLLGSNARSFLKIADKVSVKASE